MLPHVRFGLHRWSVLVSGGTQTLRRAWDPPELPSEQKGYLGQLLRTSHWKYVRVSVYIYIHFHFLFHYALSHDIEFSYKIEFKYNCAIYIWQDLIVFIHPIYKIMVTLLIPSSQSFPPLSSWKPWSPELGPALRIRTSLYNLQGPQSKEDMGPPCFWGFQDSDNRTLNQTQSPSKAGSPNNCTSHMVMSYPC